jgi:hypothetical protein
MAIVTLNPIHPIPNRDVNIFVTSELTGTNFFRIWCAIAPTGSSLDSKLKATVDPRNRVEIYADSGGTDFPLKFKFDKGGKYTLIIQEYIKGSGYGGSYKGDPAGSNSEEKNGNEYVRSIYIGQRLTQQIGPSDNRSTLAMWVWDDSVFSTYRSIHGEDTPSIIANQPSDRVKSAIESDSVKSALADLNTRTVVSILGNISTFATSFFSKFNSHIDNVSIHQSAPDTANRLDNSLSTAVTPSTIKELVNSAITKTRNHLNNDNSLDVSIVYPSVIGPGLGDYHYVIDRNNNPIYQSVSSIEDAYGGLVDLYRCLSAHLLDDTVHSDLDTTNSLPTLSPLMVVHNEYLSIIASSAPPLPAAQSIGAQTLISSAGFKES